MANDPPKAEPEAPDPNEVKVEPPEGPESGELQDFHNDLKEPLKLELLSDEKLREFVDDFVSNRIFTTAHLTNSEANMVPMIFMPLACGCFKTIQPDSLSQIGVIYEEYSKSAPRSINGKPIFFSFKMLHVDDWKRAEAAILKEQERRKNIEL